MSWSFEDLELPKVLYEVARDTEYYRKLIIEAQKDLHTLAVQGKIQTLEYEGLLDNEWRYFKKFQKLTQVQMLILNLINHKKEKKEKVTDVVEKITFRITEDLKKDLDKVKEYLASEGMEFDGSKLVRYLMNKGIEKLQLEGKIK